MNILYLANHCDTGGITSYLLTLSAGMIRRGHTVFLGSGGGRLLHRFIEEGVECIHLPIRTKQEVSPGVFLSALKISSVLGKGRIDIVHSQTRTTQVLGALLRRKGVPAFVSTCHGFFKPRLARRLFPCWGKRVIAVSREVKQHLTADLGVDEARVRIIPNGIDVEKFRAACGVSALEIKKRMGLGEGPVVGIVARLSEVKGHRYLIEAMARVSSGIPGAQLLIAGSGKDRKELVQLARVHGVEGSTVFIDDTWDSREVYRVIDVFVMPSLQEGLGLALMEAMASGRAVVGSNVGGIKTLIEHERTGVLVEPRDEKGIAQAVISLLEDGALRDAMGSRASEFIGKHFSQETMVGLTEEVYRECLEEN
jgi:glycosyltransferase involved in cell wall biosynthesis